MSATLDELAGVVDLFGGLTRTELSQAFVELGARRGAAPDEDAVEDAIERAIERFRLVRYERDGDEDLLVAGPTAFPELPDHAEDLPHIMDVESRSPDRAALGEQVIERIRGEAARAVDAGDRERIETLLDVTYDIETWAPVELGGVRDRLDDALAAVDD